MNIFIQTAYLKLIDIWLAFGLLLPFFVFLSEVLMEMYKTDQVELSSSRIAPREGSVTVMDRRDKKTIKDHQNVEMTKIVKFISRFIMPICTLIFAVVYFFVALAFYLSEDVFENV